MYLQIVLETPFVTVCDNQAFRWKLDWRRPSGELRAPPDRGPSC